MSERAEAVLLLHGLWMNRLAMVYLALALEEAGFATESLDYHSMRGTLPEHVGALADRVAGTAADAVHLVAHSLGGVVALNYLQGDAGRAHRARRAAGCAGRRIPGGACTSRTGPFGDWILGRSTDIWRSDNRAQLDATACVGAIAGSQAVRTGQRLHGRSRAQRWRRDGRRDPIAGPVRSPRVAGQPQRHADFAGGRAADCRLSAQRTFRAMKAPRALAACAWLRRSQAVRPSSITPRPSAGIWT